MSPERPEATLHEDVPYTPKMSVPGSPVAGTPIREAHSSIELLLAVAQSQSCRNGDDDLTSLSWLHERDVLKGMNINPSPTSSSNSTPVKNGLHLLVDQSPTSDYVDESSISAPESSCSSSVHSPLGVSTTVTSTPSNYSAIAHYQSGNQRVRHPHNIPYDPQIHTNNKPPYSFSCLIFMAIEDSKLKALPVKEIYAWILDHFPYFKNAPTGWKNSVRHNLSLNKCFEKVEKVPNLGKGSLWRVDPQYKPNLIQALNRSPFHPTSTVDPATAYTGPVSPQERSNSSSNNNNNSSYRVPTLPNPDLFPYLSRKLAATDLTFKNHNYSPTIGSENGACRNKESSNKFYDQNGNSTEVDQKFINIKSEQPDTSLDEADAAAVMLSLKNGAGLHGAKIEKFTLQVITTSPSQDHTYSAAENGQDEAFESDDDRYQKSRTCRKIDFDDEETKKIKEGAETLLNLAGITSRKRSLTTITHQTLPDDLIGPLPNNNKLSRLDIRENYERFDENEYHNNNNDKPTPFKPRMLRTSKKRQQSNNSSNVTCEDDWVKHRRQLESRKDR